MRLDPEGIERSYVQRMGELSDARVLEIGSGDGRLIQQYASITSALVGVDSDFTSVAQAAQDRPAYTDCQVDFAVAHGEMLPFVDQAFDGAIFAWSL